MKNWQIFGVFTFLIIGTILISGCTQDNDKYCRENYPGTTYDPVSKLCEKIGTQTHAQQTSIVGKKTDLNIGDSAVLTAKNGNKMSYTVLNFSKSDPYGGTEFYAVGIELKNVGDKAITGTESFGYWVTDWGKVNIDTALRNPLCSSTYRCISSDEPLYPGDSVTRVKYFRFSNKSLEGKLTFYYQFDDDKASWIIKSQ
jgi:hypothetical protein